MSSPVAISLSGEALSRMRLDPFLRFDPSPVAEAAYFLWLRGARGDALAHWLEAERREVLRQAKERLVFASSDKNGVVAGVFYEHYRLVASWSAADNRPRTVLGPRKPRTCCICGRNDSETAFREEAHVIPEMFGCPKLLSNEECDECNAASGSTSETELGNLTLSARAFSGTRMKRGGSPKVKAGKSYVGGGRAGLTNVASDEHQLFKVISPGLAEIEVPEAPARPAHAALAMAKMAWLMLPPALRSKHTGIRAAIRGERNVEGQPTPLFDLWIACRIPTTVAIWERVGDRDIAELVVMLACGHMALFWAAPDDTTGVNRDLLIPPLPKGADHGGQLVARRFLASGDDRTRSKTRTLTIAFERQQRTHAAAPQAARIVVCDSEREVELSTFAASPPGATSERPHFVLSGGDLVGCIEIEDAEGNDEWSWSYEALPTEGDIDRTVNVLKVSMGGGSIKISSPIDDAIFCEARFPSSLPAETNRICRAAQMAYYVGVLNGAMGTDIQLADFSFDELVQARRLALGVTHGTYAEKTRDGRHTIDADAPMIAKLRESLGSGTTTFCLRGEIRDDVLGTEIEVGPTRLVLFDATVDGDWDTMLKVAERDGSAAVTFLCPEVGHVFERYAKPSSDGHALNETR